VFQKGDMKRLHVEDTQILGPTVQNLEARVNWRSEFVHPWDKVYLNVL
jgi:hypothetical protein